jgi:predicted amidohydrolase YtcJ
LRCQLGGLQTLDQVLSALKPCSEEIAPGNWLRGVGLPMDLLGTTAAELARLDRATAGYPTLLAAEDGHTVWCNSEALVIASIDASQPDPGFGSVGRDPGTGALTGVLGGSAIGKLWLLQSDYSERELREALRRASALANSYGITTSDESSARPEHWRAYRAAEAAGEMTLRVTAALRWDSERDNGQLPELQALREAATGPLFRAHAIKLFLDGDSGRSGNLLEPYAGTDDEYGHSVYGERLPAVVAAIDAAGFDLHAHAYGDAAVRDGLDAVQAAITANPSSERRHQLAHLALVHPEDLPRFRALDVSADIQPLWAWVNKERRKEIESLGPERARRLLAFRDLFDSGARVAAGSDWISVSVNPLYGIQVAVTRRPPDGSGPAWNPEQRVTLEEMLKAYTINGAWLARQEELTGSIEVGKAADLVVLERNLFEVDPMTLKEVRVLMTLLNGEVVYTRESLVP